MDMGMFVLIAVLTAAVVITILALMIGRKPVVTEFEARQRGLQVPERSAEGKAKTREISEATMRTAMKLVLVFIAGLAVVSAITYLQWREYLLYLTPAYVGAAVLLFFFMMWLDEERMKARYQEMRIER